MSKHAEKNIKITKIVFGVVQFIINLFEARHGKISLKEDLNALNEAKDGNTIALQ